MADFFLRILVLSFSIYFVGKITKLFIVEDFLTAIITALVLALVNAVIRPILILVTFPLTIITLGIFLFFVNGLCLIIVSALVPKFKVKGCLNSAIAALLISLTNLLLEWITGF
ncbi:MAG: phage holin family protein [Candidatus Cloacimonetes bacterium]|nr:phage holin family protein [Candidatus Cloacimonadota bacterium]